MSKTSKRCPQCNRIVPTRRIRQGWTSEFCSTQCIDAHFANGVVAVRREREAGDLSLWQGDGVPNGAA